MEYHQRILLLCLSQSVILSMLISRITALPSLMKIGGLFETDDEQLDIAFHRAIKMINDDGSQLPGSRLEGRMKRVAPQDSFRAYNTVCEFLVEGVVAIIGPKSPSNEGVSQATCSTFEVPLFQTHWAKRSIPRSHTINLFPESMRVASAFSSFLKKQPWKSFTFIFDDIDALIRLQEITQIRKTAEFPAKKILLREVKPEEDFKKLMKDLKRAGENNFVVDLPIHRVKELFAGAASVEMMTEYQNYMLTSFDVHTVEWHEDFIGRTNISAFRLIDPANKKFENFLNEWIFQDQTVNADAYIPSKQPIKTESALLYDAVSMVANTIRQLDQNGRVELRSLNCDEERKWPEGTPIVNYMKYTPFPGVSGEIKLDSNGLRTKFKLDLVKIMKKSIIKTAIWDTEKGLQYIDAPEAEISASDLLRNKVLKVTACQNEPYVFLDQDYLQENKTERYIGFCIDLLNQLSALQGWNYTLSIRADGAYGKYVNGEWTGMIGQLLRHEADLAITDLTITYEREQAVDFTMPFMNLGVAIVFKKPGKQNPPMFSFLKPLSLEVWFYMGTGYLGVSLFLFILARLSPYEWVNPHPCETENDVVENQFTLLNSFWFTIGSIMQQGSDILPRAVSTRIVASSWWFFTLIMISSYTANLAAFLTAQRMTSPINSASDLAKQTTIEYGCKRDGSTYTFFKDSKYPIYQRMWSYMESQRPTVFVDSNEQGINRVKMGNYAYLMESTSIEYETERECDIMRIGSNLDSKGYGIATPPGSPFRSAISSGILYLQEKQKLQILKDQWWKEFGITPNTTCSDDTGIPSAEMGVKNVGGVFLVLGIGSCLGIIIVIMEFIWKASKMVERDPIIVMLWQELRSTLTCRGSTRPAPKEEEESVDMVHMMKSEYS